ncbi:MAG: hypothetical protein K1X44_00365 [Alphaproteobacteria bacterium]|nr:hypothetical protein [Alphaproteobacteria bacterium]
MFGFAESYAQFGPPIPILQEKNSPQDISSFLENNTKSDLGMPIYFAGSKETHLINNTLDTKEGGLTQDLWNGVDQVRVEKLIKELPITQKTYVLRNLMKRLLMTNSSSPKGFNLDQFMSLKAQLLVKLGDGKAVADLLDYKSINLLDWPVARMKLDALLWSDQIERMCHEIKEDIMVFNNQPYWHQLKFFCQWYKEHTIPILNASEKKLLGSNGDFFLRLFNWQNEQKDSDKKENFVTALYFTILKINNQLLPQSFYKITEPIWLISFIESKDLDPILRRYAAEQGVRQGLFFYENLAPLYSNFGIVDQSNKQDEIILKNYPAIWKKLQQDNNPEDRVVFLQKIFVEARKQGIYKEIAPLYAPFVLEIKPTQELGWFALEAGRLLYFLGFDDQANGWLEIVKSLVPTRPEMKIQMQKLMVLSIIGTSDVKAEIDYAFLWSIINQEIEKNSLNISNTKRISRLSAALTLSYKKEEKDWTEIADNFSDATETEIDTELWFATGDAAVAKYQGLTLLLLFKIFGTTSPGAQKAMYIQKALESLYMIGLYKEARQLALAVAIDNGL